MDEAPELSTHQLADKPSGSLTHSSSEVALSEGVAAPCTPDASEKDTDGDSDDIAMVDGDSLDSMEAAVQQLLVEMGENPSRQVSLPWAWSMGPPCCMAGWVPCRVCIVVLLVLACTGHEPAMPPTMQGFMVTLACITLGQSDENKELTLLMIPKSNQSSKFSDCHV